MTKYIHYFREIIREGNFTLLIHSLNYFFYKKVPSTQLVIHNTAMGDYICRSNTTDFMYTLYSYEHKVKDLIKLHASEFDTYLDIGACIGEYSIWLAKQGLKCYTFEPNKENIKTLKANVYLNQMEEQINIQEYGLGDKQETVTFQSHPTNKGYSGQFYPFNDKSKLEAEIKTLDECIEDLHSDLNQGFIVKMDVEGMESMVIDGGQRFLREADRILLIFEAHTEKAQIMRKLKEITDYSIIEVDELNHAVYINHVA